MSYKIVKIINPTSFVINAGRHQSIEEGNVFQILGATGDAVPDPDSGEILGTLDEVKGIITAETVYENISICRSETRTIGMMPTVVTSFTRHIELDVDESQITGGAPKSAPIKIGDKVVQI